MTWFIITIGTVDLFLFLSLLLHKHTHKQTHNVFIWSFAFYCDNIYKSLSNKCFTANTNNGKTFSTCWTSLLSETEEASCLLTRSHAESKTTDWLMHCWINPFLFDLKQIPASNHVPPTNLRILYLDRIVLFFCFFCSQETPVDSICSSRTVITILTQIE